MPEFTDAELAVERVRAEKLMNLALKHGYMDAANAHRQTNDAIKAELGERVRKQ